MRPLSIADGMSEEQKSEVKRKARAETEEDKWRRIWRILFPMDAEADIPKPCKLALARYIYYDFFPDWPQIIQFMDPLVCKQRIHPNYR